MVSMSQAKMEKRALPKRFYKHAAYNEANGHYIIQLDGRSIKTPGKKMLQVAAPSLAAAIVAEWEAQTEVIDPDLMPLTRLVHIALDRVPQERKALLQDIAQYVETDLLCYRVPVESADNPLAADNLALRKKQDAAFDPILNWIKTTYHASFTITEGILPAAQPAESCAAIAAVFSAAKDDELAAIALMVPLLGSALLTLALWKGQIDLKGALEAARLDELAQAEQWGEDPMAAAAWAAKAKDITAAVFYLTGK